MSNFSPVHNHLIIGLGGTGGKIIRELKKIIAADSVENRDVNFEYLYMDTGPDILKQTAEWRVLGKSIELAQAQILLSTAADLRPVLDNLDAYEGLRNWVKPLEPFDSVEPGTANAGQRRKLGRLLFARNAGKFMEMARDRVRTLQAKKNSSDLTIHIACGLAGGTGSGSVVDVVALLREEYPDVARARIIVYAFLPEKNPSFGDENGRYYANGYAALAELNALSVGAYLPYNVITGERIAKRDVFFNSCYLINNENERGTIVDVQAELPRIVAEFLFQKTLGLHWEGLDRAEKSENGNNDHETSVDGEGRAERSKRFITFGIKRIVVPEDEIKESLTYSFATEVTNQLMFNNWRDGVGFADEDRLQDFASYVRQPEQTNRWQLSDDHLILGVGILPEDAANTRWKRIGEFWSTFVATQKQSIKSEMSKQRWLDELIKVCEDMYANSYRNLGGVKKFYQTKEKAGDEIASHLVREIERELFAEWRNGVRSLSEARKLVATLRSSLEERLKNVDGNIAGARGKEEEASAKKADLVAEWGRIGWVSDHVFGKGERLFNSAAEELIEIYTSKTSAEGWLFAKKLIETTLAKLSELLLSLERMQSKLDRATQQFKIGIDTRLKKTNSVFQERLFNPDAIESVRKALLLDEQAQKARIQGLRTEIIARAGTNVDSFARLNDKVNEDILISALEQGAKAAVVLAHNELGKGTRKVLGVNIVERLYEDYGASEDELSRYVKDTINSAGVFLTFDPAEKDKQGLGTDNYPKHKKTSGLFLPNCEGNQGFRDKLAALFEANKLSDEFRVLSEGARANELVMLTMDNLFPLRFVRPTSFLHKAYERLSRDREKFFLHGEGDGSNLPPLYIPSAREVAQGKRHYVVLGKLLGMIVDRPNVGTGRRETVLNYEEDGLPSEKVLGGSLEEVLTSSDVRVIAEIEKQVMEVLDSAKYRHIDAKNEAYDQYRQFVKESLASVGGNQQDPKFQAIRGMAESIKSALNLNP